VKISAAAARIAPLVPGVALCVLVTLVAVSIQAAEETTVGHPYVEAIVVAILLGMAIRTVWEPGRRFHSGIAFSAKQLLEVAVALLGTSITFAAVAAAQRTSNVTASGTSSDVTSALRLMAMPANTPATAST
jgi:uncharacterized membrane protein YadS